MWNRHDQKAYVIHCFAKRECKSLCYLFLKFVAFELVVLSFYQTNSTLSYLPSLVSEFSLWLEDISWISALFRPRPLVKIECEICENTSWSFYTWIKKTFLKVALYLTLVRNLWMIFQINMRFVEIFCCFVKSNKPVQLSRNAFCILLLSSLNLL